MHIIGTTEYTALRIKEVLLLNKLRNFIWSKFGQDIPLAVLETTEACWANEAKRPQIHKKTKTKLGWDILFALPPGMCYKEFVAKAEYFRDAIGDVTTECQHVGKMALLKIITNRIGDMYEYEYNYKNVGALPIPIGYTHNGLITVDLADIPHILIGGITGGGKSNSIHFIVSSLLNAGAPPKIILIDLKMSEFTYLENHVLLITEQKTASQVLDRLVAEMKNRQQLLKGARCVNIKKYNQKHEHLDYIVLIIDELAELTDAGAQENLECLLRLCRASGICIVAATQRPSSTMFSKKSFGDCKCNFAGRLCFGVADGVNSKIILDSTEAAELPNIPGRAIWKLGKTTEVQTPYLDPEIAEERLYEQSTIRSAQGFFDGGNNQRVGNHDNRPNTNIAVPIGKSGTAKTSKTLLTKTAESLRTNSSIQLLCGKAKKYFTEN